MWVSVHLALLGALFQLLHLIVWQIWGFATTSFIPLHYVLQLEPQCSLAAIITRCTWVALQKLQTRFPDTTARFHPRLQRWRKFCACRVMQLRFLENGTWLLRGSKALQAHLIAGRVVLVSTSFTEFSGQSHRSGSLRCMTKPLLFPHTLENPIIT